MGELRSLTSNQTGAPELEVQFLNQLGHQGIPSPFFKFYLLLNFLFYIGVLQINNVVIVLGEQQTDSAMHICIFTLPKPSLTFKLAYNNVHGAILKWITN